MNQGQTRHVASRVWRTIAAALALLLVPLATTTGPTAQAEGGAVTCANSMGQLVGVYVHVYGGTSGWAYWKPQMGTAYTPNGQASGTWSYNTQGKNFKLSVGCGGSKSSWGSNYTSSAWSKNYNQTCIFNYLRYTGPCVKA